MEGPETQSYNPSTIFLSEKEYEITNKNLKNHFKGSGGTPSGKDG
jgi:hypothetical protein